MNASWRQVKELVQAALERTPDARAAYLSQACGGDDGLRLEVESLLSAHERAGSFLERRAPSPQGGLQPPSGDRNPAEWRLCIGDHLGPFRILGRLGAGGMGEVYRARDTRLNRTVAIKILLARLADQPELRTLLEREAVATSALNHPNICALYDVGHQDGVDFLVMEYLDGEALDQRLARGALPADQVLRVAIEITGALAQAHANGVLHRDIKPSNVMLTTSGAKLLDFGLAKLRDPHFAPVGAGSGYTVLTREGALLGTLPYMAPEQLEGRPTDVRTDLFALGAILYEMLTGRPPFADSSQAGVIAAILDREPPPIGVLQPQVPASLDAVVMRCLAKDPEQRWPSCGKLFDELEQISVTDVAARGRSTPTRLRAPNVPLPWGRRRQSVIAAVTAAAAVSTIVFGVASREPTTGATPASEWVPLTNFADSVTSPALSRDGRMLAFLRGADTFASSGQIYVKLLPDGEPVEVTHDDTLKMGPVFSPDGARIAYTVPVLWETWILSALGGRSRLWLPNASGLTWIDNGRLLFAEIKGGRHMALVTSTDNRADVRDVYVPASDTGMAHRASLSPDGRSVLVVEMDSAGWVPCRLVPFDGSSVGRRVGPANAACTAAAWSPDGRWMYFSANAGGTFHIWRERVADGTSEQVTGGPTEEEGVAMAPDGRSLVTSVGMTQKTVWIRKNGVDQQVASQMQATLPGSEGRSGRSVFGPGAKKLYYLGADGSAPLHPSGALRVIDLESGASEPVLTGFAVTSFDISQDGKQVVFAAVEKGGFSIWIASLDHRFAPRPIARSSTDHNPVFRGGNEILFQSNDGSSTFVYLVNADGSGRKKFLPQQVIEFETVSPDGQWVVVEVAIHGDDGPRATVAYPADGGAPLRVCSGLCTVRWSLDARVLYVGWPRSNESTEAWRTFGIPLGTNEIFPDLPASGIMSESELAAFRGVTATEGAVYPGPDSSIHAFTRRSVHRNLYRIPLH